MLGVLCSRPKPWIFSTLSSFFHGSAAAYNNHNSRIVQTQVQFSDSGQRLFSRSRRHHSSVCKFGGGGSCAGGAASIWHAIMPATGHGREWNDFRRSVIIHHELKGEGSWNVAWDSRPARWLHRPDSAWLLFGVCACLAPLGWVDTNPENGDVKDVKIDGASNTSVSDETNGISFDYRVTGVPADGRCLFRAIAHGACLRGGKEAPDENIQRELADELRALVANELQTRREETEWFIEGDFDTYVKRIQQPYAWGGEPELLMASHVLKTPISVFMRDRSTGGLVNIAKYGEEYKEEKENPINVLFHGYGHYDLLETLVKTV